jgi:uncharacterized protein (DUF2062 family)
MSGRVRRALQVLLHVEDTPHRIALAFGIGIWIAFCPLLGVHTIMALAIAFAFRLSRVAILLGAYVNNPWTLAPLFLAGTVVGCVLMGVSTDGLAAVDWNLEGTEFYAALLERLGVAGGVVGYAILRRLLERRALRAA